MLHQRMRGTEADCHPCLAFAPPPRAPPAARVKHEVGRGERVAVADLEHEHEALELNLFEFHAIYATVSFSKVSTDGLGHGGGQI